MKTIRFFGNVILSMAVTLFLFACSNEEDLVTNVENDGNGWHTAKVNLNVSRTSFDDEGTTSRAVSDGWKDGDRIYLRLEDKDHGMARAYVQYNASTGSWGQVEYNTSTYNLTCTTPRKVEAFFFDGAYEDKSLLVSFTAQTGIYQCTDGSYTYPSGEDLTINISLTPATSRIRFTGSANLTAQVAGLRTYTGYDKETGKLLETYEEVPVQVGTDSTSPYVYAFFCNEENPKLMVTVNNNVFDTSFAPTTTVLQKGRSGYMAMPTIDNHQGWRYLSSEIYTNGHGFVDLALPSGSLWATCNIGGSVPEDKGDYFAWGETTPKKKYTQDNYTYSDNPDVLPLDRDAASVNWGGSWRTPTKEQCQELIDECIWTNTTINGVDGELVTSKINSNAIFLPYVGYCCDNYTPTEPANQYSSYCWTSTACNNNSSYCFYSEYLSNYSRYYGMTIRPVLK